MLQGWLHHSESQHLLFIVPEGLSIRNCSSCSAFEPKVHFSLRAQKKFMPELTKKVFVLINTKRTQRKHLVSGHQDWDFTQRRWHFDSVEAKIKTHAKKTRTSAKYWKFLSKNILWQGKRYFSEQHLRGQTPPLLECFKNDMLPGFRDVGCKF